MVTMNKKHSYGFSLVEVMVAMVVGLIILSGVFALHSATRKTQAKNEEQMDMVADARFAIEMLTYDLRHTGMWGGTNKYELIECKYNGSNCASASVGGEILPTLLAGDCAAGWYYDIEFPIVGISSASTAYTNCIKNRRGGTDMLAVRYADPSPQAALVKGQAYVRSNALGGRIFIGEKAPFLDSNESAAMTQNRELHANLYYIATYSDVVGDGIPSLRRASLISGPDVEDQLLIPGVHDFQVAYGEDTNKDTMIDRYIDADKVTDWKRVYAVKIWFVMRTDEKQDTKITTTKTFDVDGVATAYGADGYRYFMVSTVVNLRNVRRIVDKI